jgi:2-methylcitrate dehydratase PrpD
MDTISKTLAEWCATVRDTEIPREIYDLVRPRMLDTVGLIIAASATPAVKAAEAMAIGIEGAEKSTLVGGRCRVPAAFAAFVHGIAAHCYDFDDTFPDSVVHPGSIVIPTALAVAEAHECLPDAFSTSVVIGYEVAARLGSPGGRRFHARHLHASGVIGPIVAAVVAGRLMRLDAQQLSWAIGLASSMSSGIRAYTIDGGWSKWLHLGWAAHGGIVAAELASKGFRGPEYVLDGGMDLYAALLYGEAVDRSSILADLGREWRGTNSETKYYPCAHVSQPFIEAVLCIVHEHNLCAKDIESIQCAIAPWAAAIVCEPVEAKLRFGSELEATGSLPYQVSVAVLDRCVTLQSITKECRQRQDIADFCRRVSYRKDETLGGRFDGLVTVRTKSGADIERKATLAPLSVTKIRGKFADLAGPVLGQGPTAIAAALLMDTQGWQPAATVLGFAQN